MAALIELGVDGMFTNFLDRLTALRASDQPRGKHGAGKTACAGKR